MTREELLAQYEEKYPDIDNGPTAMLNKMRVVFMKGATLEDWEIIHEIIIDHISVLRQINQLIDEHMSDRNKITFKGVEDNATFGAIGSAIIYHVTGGVTTFKRSIKRIESKLREMDLDYDVKYPFIFKRYRVGLDTQDLANLIPTVNAYLEHVLKRELGEYEAKIDIALVFGDINGAHYDFYKANEFARNWYCRNLDKAPSRQNDPYLHLELLVNFKDLDDTGQYMDNIFHIIDKAIEEMYDHQILNRITVDIGLSCNRL